MQNLSIAHGKWNRAFADTPSHARHERKKECVVCSHSQSCADQRSHDRCNDRSGRKWNESFQKSLDQHASIHTKDAADNNCGDKQVEEVSVLKKGRHWLQQRSRKQMIKGQT